MPGMSARDAATDAALMEMADYRDRLRRYTRDELEDIYFNIHILKHPVRYRLLVLEMERRGIIPAAGALAQGRPIDLPTWLESRPFLARRRWLLALTRAVAAFLASACATAALLLPIWMFAIPLGFRGIQASLVYFACLPVALIMGAGVGGRLGGRGPYAVFTLLGVAAALAAFNATGAASAIIRSIMESSGGGGFGIGM